MAAISSCDLARADGAIHRASDRERTQLRVDVHSCPFPGANSSPFGSSRGREMGSKGR
jgi:hypothetical protein